MERETRNKKRTDSDRVTTSRIARVLRFRPSNRLLLVVVLANAVAALVPIVGCSSWRSFGRVDSPRGEYFLEEKEAEEIWRDSASKDSSIRGKEIETYDAASDSYDGDKESGISLTERFKYMFRKPKYPETVSSRWNSNDNSEIADSSKYVKNDALPDASRASLSGKPDGYDSSKESFWTKLFKTFHSDSFESEFESEREPKARVEERSGGLARDEVKNEPNQTSPIDQTPRTPYVRKRWSSRDPQNVRPSVPANPQGVARTNVAANPQGVARTNAVANPPIVAQVDVATKQRNNLGATLIRQYDARQFLPPFDVVERYYYPSGNAAATTSENGAKLTSYESSVVPNNAASRPYQSSYSAPTSVPSTVNSVTQTSYYSAQTAESSQIQNHDANCSNSQESSILERRREFDWFDSAPSSSASNERANEVSSTPLPAELERETSANLPTQRASQTNARRSADDILDESAQRARVVDNFSASKSVAYETSASKQESRASKIGVDVLESAKNPSNFDVSSFLNQTNEMDGAVDAINSIGERKAENSAAPLTREEIEWVEHVEEAIQGLLAERAELKKRGEDTSLCDARLRLLYLVVGEYDRQIQEIVDSADPLKVFWEKECDGLETLLKNKLEEIDPIFVAETLMSGLDSFFDVCDVQIRKALLVDAPACFGLFEERVKPYRPGEVVYAYAELDYVVSKETTRGHEIAVECRWRLLDSNGTALTDFKTQRCENVAETRLRDVVLNVAVPLSDEIAPNDYLLEMEIVDLNARESVAATRRLNLKVVAKPERGARG